MSRTTTKKPTKTEQKQLLVEENNVESSIDPSKLFAIKLSRCELIHLRDILSIRLPPTFDVTLSEDLAQKTNRRMVEKTLWNKLGNACETANIALGDEAPDFVINISGPAPVNVFEVQLDPEVEEYVEEDPNKLFSGKQDA